MNIEIRSVQSYAEKFLNFLFISNKFLVLRLQKKVPLKYIVLDPTFILSGNTDHR